MVNHPNRRKKIAASGTAVGPIKRSRAAPQRLAARAQAEHDADYARLLESVCVNFRQQAGPLFCTDATGLWEAFHASLPAEHGIHDCRACRHFVERFGGLVSIDASGAKWPALWSVVASVPGFYAASIAALRKRIDGAKVTGPFLTGTRVLGQPQTGIWSHLAITEAPVFRHGVLTPEQAMAAKREDYGTVQRALARYYLANATKGKSADFSHSAPSAGSSLP